jgi:Na+/H+ antiporter NhaD/arsenite permease-like protein
MRGDAMLLATMALMVVPGWAAGAEAPALPLPLWSVAPFVLLLLAIAVLPLTATHFWEANRNKALVAAIFALPVAGYLLTLGPQGTASLLHALGEYASFIILLASLYTVSGGIVLRGDIQGRPLTNTAFLAFGAVIANLIGTTGASMLLIRPVLRINQERQRVGHLPIFFIFVVSNLGGLLTPLGDPPLFLGFLKGVDFFWTLSLWPQWLVANGIVLVIFFLWDSIAYRRESHRAIAADIQQIEPLRVEGLLNLLFLTGIILAVLFQSETVATKAQAWLSQFVAVPPLRLPHPWAELVMVAMGLASLAMTPRRLRQANGFNWHPITEVAVLFAGIFVAMVPALEVLRVEGPKLGLSEPWQYFWLTGLLSSFLDNAPTYVAFGTVARGLADDFGWLILHKEEILAAISCGAVFMGANTYIGNGPNFMVKAIADQAGFKTPSFFGYMAYSGLILLPVFVLITFLFFPPGG